MVWWTFVAAALATPAMVPQLDGPFSPSNLRVVGDAERLAKTEDCAGCHPSEAEAWKGSAHANASLNNPWYLASFLSVRQEEGLPAVQHCGGCHDPSLLVANAMDAGPEHPLASVGVSCLSCHAQVAAGPAGNASMTIDLTDLPDPRVDVDAHRRRMRPTTINDGTACQGCHRGVLVPEMGAQHALTGFDDWGSWLGSAWAGSGTTRHEPEKAFTTCVDCHDHAAAAGRTAIAASTGRLARAESLLRRAARLWAPAARVDGVWVEIGPDFAPDKGAEVLLELVVRNVGAGHRFPGGLADTQDTWVQVELHHQDGTASIDGPHLRALPMQGDGSPERLHRPHLIVGAAFDHTIPPGEAQVMRVGFEAPGGPLHIDAHLMHRSHRPELHEAACAVTNEHTLDGCAPQPTTLIAQLEPNSADAWYALALGRSRGRSEDLDDALDALTKAEALGLDPASAGVLEARILGAAGRVDAALQSLEGLPPHPSVPATRARAYDAVWDWKGSAAEWAEVTALVPRSVEGWAGLARAEGALNHPEKSLRAAQSGLALTPRHPELLRSQALALQAMGSSEAGTAQAAWLAHRPAEEIVALRLRCDRLESECDERGAVPTLWATPFIR